jgi:hypothetical protein
LKNAGKRTRNPHPSTIKQSTRKIKVKQTKLEVKIYCWMVVISVNCLTGKKLTGISIRIGQNTEEILSKFQ